jgi:transposase-like protein
VFGEDGSGSNLNVQNSWTNEAFAVVVQFEVLRLDTRNRETGIYLQSTAIRSRETAINWSEIALTFKKSSSTLRKWSQTLNKSGQTFNFQPSTLNFPAHRERSSLTGDIAGTRSQTALIETRIGTDNNAPGTPHSQIQKINEIKMTTGLRVNRRPSNTGVTRFASNRWSTKYQAGGRSPCHSVSKVSRPTVASRITPATGPK